MKLAMNGLRALFVLLCINYAHADMSMVAYSATIRNACNYQVEIAFQLSDRIGPKISQLVNANETFDVLGYYPCIGTRGIFTIGAFVSPINELKNCLPDDYELMISANGNKINLNKTQFLDILKRAKLSRSPNYTVYRWEIDESSLCP